MSMKKDAFYFPHFSNSRNDNKIIKLRRVLGMQGYGIYFALLEVLRETTDFRIPKSSIEDLAYDWHVSKEIVAEVVSRYDLFQFDEEHFFSAKFNEYMIPYISGKESRRIGGLKGNLIKCKYITKEESFNMSDEEIEEMDRLIKIAKEEGKTLNLPKGKVTDQTPTPCASQSKVKESKVKESKVKESIYPTEEEFIEYALDKASSVSIKLDITKVKLKYSSWSENNWINGNDKKIKNWKSTLNNTLVYLKSEGTSKGVTNFINEGETDDSTTRALQMSQELRAGREGLEGVDPNASIEEQIRQYTELHPNWKEEEGKDQKYIM